MIQSARLAGGLLAVALLAACAADPVRFYTLVPPDDGTPRPPRAPYLIEVAPVDVPAQAQGPQMVLRQGNGEILLMEQQRWIAPVAEEVRQTVVNRLTRTLGTTDVYDLARPSGMPVYRIKIELTRFESRLGRRAQVEAAWSLRRTTAGDEVATCTSLASETIGPGYAALVEGHQRAILRIADEVAASLQALAEGQPPGCP